MTASKASDSPDPHPSDGVLLALHDAESGGTLDAERAHVDQCAHCQTRLAAIQTTRRPSDRRPSERPPPTQGSTSGACHSPLATAGDHGRGGARCGDGHDGGRGPAASLDCRTHEPPERPSRRRPALEDVSRMSQRPVSGPTLSFAVVGSGLVVRLDSMPAAGELTIEPAKTDKISARVSAGVGTGGDTMVVLPGELRLRNTTASRASYTLALPTDVARLRVIVAGRVVFNGSPPKQVKLTGH